MIRGHLADKQIARLIKISRRQRNLNPPPSTITSDKHVFPVVSDNHCSLAIGSCYLQGGRGDCAIDQVRVGREAEDPIVFWYPGEGGEGRGGEGRGREGRGGKLQNNCYFCRCM